MTDFNIAGVTFDTEDHYAGEIETSNELGVVAELRKLPDNEFRAGMQTLMTFLNSIPSEYVVDRYVRLLVEVAGGEPEDING